MSPDDLEEEIRNEPDNGETTGSPERSIIDDALTQIHHKTKPLIVLLCGSMNEPLIMV